MIDRSKYKYYSRVITIIQEDDLKLQMRSIPYDDKIVYIVRNLDVEIYDIQTFEEAVQVYNVLKTKWND